MQKQPLIILTGPTAVGKTKASIGLAKAIGGEIISADSMQVYKYMDIGSAKIRPEEMQYVPHYLVDELEPDDEFHVVRFQQMAKEAMKKIYAAGHIPIVVGGTGFYIQAIVKDIDFSENTEAGSYRKELEAMAKEKGVQILPVDSEHSAIFQAIHGEDKREIHKLLITASGGPFRGMKASDLAHVKVEDALKHPNWAMGQKITIDSATLVNKGLEVMEAKWLFDVDLDHIQVVVQPKSIIHSMVEFVDGAVMAQLGTPDMKLPIQYALYYPHRRYLPGERLDFKTLTEITFEEPDMETFLGLPMAMEASRRGGSMPTVFNAANERAVAKFLHGQIGFLDIYRSIREAMDRHQVIEHPCLEEILETEAKTYEWMESRWSV